MYKMADISLEFIAAQLQSLQAGQRDIQETLRDHGERFDRIEQELSQFREENTVTTAMAMRRLEKRMDDAGR